MSWEHSMGRTPILTGDPRTDRALILIARLLLEIALNAQASGEVDTERGCATDECPPRPCRPVRPVLERTVAANSDGND